MLFFFFFKQKTAYEMRISDWSSDVCSSDLAGGAAPRPAGARRLAGGPLRRQPHHAQPRRARRARPRAVRLRASGGLGRGPGPGARHPGEHRGGGGAHLRSEEHTSELQSLMRTSIAGSCLKKKTLKNITLR